MSLAFLMALPAAAIPVIHHLFNRRRRKVIKWGAMMFLMEANVVMRRWMRLSDLLLLILRTLALLFFILAMAKPTMSLFSLGGLHERDVILVVDDSLSMSLKKGEGMLFDELRNAFADKLETYTPEDRIRVLMAGTPMRWLMPQAVHGDAKGKRDLERAMRRVKVRATGVRVLDSLFAALQAEAVEDTSSRQIVLFTDRQKHGWRSEAPGLWHDLMHQCSQASLPTKIERVELEVPDKVRNMSLVDLKVSHSLVVPGKRVSFTAKVANTGTRVDTGSRLKWSLDGKSLGVTPVGKLEPKGEKSLSLHWTSTSVGPHVLRAEIVTDDDLMRDNHLEWVIEVNDKFPILVIGERDNPLMARGKKGKTASSRPEGASFVMAGLGEGQEDIVTDFRATYRHTGELDKVLLSSYAAVIVCNVTSIAPDFLIRLSRFVRKGGGLWVAIGDRVSVKEFNRHWVAQGLAPHGIVLPKSGLRAVKERVFPNLKPHPATVLLNDTKKVDLTSIVITRRHRFMDKVDKKRVLLWGERQEPIAVEGRLGKGRVIVQGIPFDRRWSNLPLTQAFVVMLYDWLDYLAHSSGQGWNISHGQNLSLELKDLKTRPESIQLIDASGREHELKVPKSNSFELNEMASVPGQYRYVVNYPQGKSQAYPFVVRRDLDESNLTRVDDALVKKLWEVPLQSDDLGEQAGASSKQRDPIWHWLFFAILAFFIGEMMLSAFMNHRRFAGSSRRAHA